MKSFTHFITEAVESVELYHGTSARRAAQIKRDGFRIRAVPQQTMGGDPESHRDYVWFAKRFDAAARYAEMHTNPVVITVRLPKSLLQQIDPYGRNSGPDSVWVAQAIPAKYIVDIKTL